MKLLKRHWPTLLGAALGALGGYLYWYFDLLVKTGAETPQKQENATL